MRLALHLENQQSVVFRDDADIEGVLSVEKHSTLTGWFLANQKFPSARAISYLEFPEYFVWDKTKREWKQRMKGYGTMIGRVYSAHPSEGELLENSFESRHWLYQLSVYSYSSRRNCLWYLQGGCMPPRIARR